VNMVDDVLSMQLYARSSVSELIKMMKKIKITMGWSRACEAEQCCPASTR
jgi:hypothetical protein